jgi:Cu+-exporting ATPase
MLIDKLTATNIRFSDDKSIIEFTSDEQISIEQLNINLAEIGKYQVSENAFNDTIDNAVVVTKVDTSKNDIIQSNNMVSEFNLQNVKCASCVSKIETKLANINGISSAQVSLIDKTLVVKYTKDNLDKEVMSAVESIGYIATKEKVETKSEPKVFLNIGLPILIGMFMMTFGMNEKLMHFFDYKSLIGLVYGVAEIIITLFVIVLCGKTIVKSGIKGFYTLSFNMYSLVVLGIGAAWLYSSGIIIASYFFHYTGMQHVYFESALIIIGLMNLGAFLEDRAKSNTSSAIKSLMALQPNETTIIKDNKEQLIKTNLLANGDIIKIKPGERLPADGVIIDGNGYLDESMITGEPIAIYKKANDKVIAGSINTNGSFTFQASGVGNNTFLAEIIKLVKDAQISKPELAKLADKVAGIFVPTIILIAIFSALIWYFIGPEPKMFYSVSIFMTVLIIACPCSVGLAVPVALMVGLGKSATKGILIRDTSCLSKIDKLDYILLDKTGTITKGKPEVVNFQVSDGYSKSECLSIIKSLENNSEHPLAAAMLTFASNNDTTMLETTEFEMIAGSGLSAVINDIKYYIVSKHYVQNSLHLDSELIVRNHFTQAFLATDNDVLARIDISDTIKDDSINAIKKLQSIGLKVAMVTGDNQENAEYIAEQIGLDKVYANCKPQDKIEIVKSMQENYNVAFVGDGINDAPSLVQADVGIAIGSGTDIAMQSAQITLINSSLDGISKAITIGKSINKNMKQNLFGSFVYNTLAVAIAAGALYPFGHVLLNPIIASTAMSLSSITVILNALRLKYL